jgi:hypothetical protein
MKFLPLFQFYNPQPSNLITTVTPGKHAGTHFNTIKKNYNSHITHLSKFYVKLCNQIRLIIRLIRCQRSAASDSAASEAQQHS